MARKHAWAAMPSTERAAVFLRAADLLAGPVAGKIAAATMTRTIQVRVPGRDRTTVRAHRLLAVQTSRVARQILGANEPISGPRGVEPDRLPPLDGFVLMRSRRSTSPRSPATFRRRRPDGNTVLWKPSITQTRRRTCSCNLLEGRGATARG